MRGKSPETGKDTNQRAGPGTFGNIEPGTYLIKIYRENPFLRNSRKYIGFKMIVNIIQLWQQRMELLYNDYYR